LRVASAGSHKMHRLSVASRILAAAAGGYALASLMTIAVPLLLPVFGANQAQSLLMTSLLSFPMYAGVVMAVFHARTATRAWIGLVIAAIPLVLVYVFLHGGGQG
jgi:hypothetical protein